MLYWLIPYLVAYNASNPSDWKNGPEHVFKVEMRFNASQDIQHPAYIDLDLYMPCRPLNASSIECRIESTKATSYLKDRIRGVTVIPYLDANDTALDGNVFRVGFNEKGVHHIRFLNDSGNWPLEMIREIVDTVNLNIDLSEKSYENYVSADSSYIGNCTTNIDINSESLREEELAKYRLREPIKAIEGYNFEVPAVKGRTSDKPIVIRKQRILNNCMTKEPAMFFTAFARVPEPHYEKREATILSSESTIYLGSNSFSAYARNIGTVNGSYVNDRGITEELFIQYYEVLRVNLDSIRPAKENL